MLVAEEVVRLVFQVLMPQEEQVVVGQVEKLALVWSQDLQTLVVVVVVLVIQAHQETI
jgi:hypothetical protein